MPSSSSIQIQIQDLLGHSLEQLRCTVKAILAAMMEWPWKTYTVNWVAIRKLATLIKSSESETKVEKTQTKMTSRRPITDHLAPAFSIFTSRRSITAHLAPAFSIFTSRRSITDHLAPAFSIFTSSVSTVKCTKLLLIYLVTYLEDQP